MSEYFSAVHGPQNVTYVRPLPVTAGADARGGALRQVTVTLPVANTVYSVVLPTTARGFSLTPTLGDIIFAVGEDPAAGATITGNAVSANFSIGDTALAGNETVRVLDEEIANAGASLRLRSVTANAVCRVATF